MAQARIKLKLSGFKVEVGNLEVELMGERNEMPQLKDAALQHVRGLLGPAAQVVEGATAQAQRTLPFGDGSPAVEERGDSQLASRPRAARRAKAASGKNVAKANAASLEWKPDTQRFGEPKVTWSNFDKGAWLLHFYSKEQGAGGLAAGVIAATFNKHFARAKQIVLAYLTRDLQRNAKSARPQVSEDSTQDPTVWHLTDFGAHHVEELIAKAKTTGPNGAA
jgi:hypothetical protein